MKKKKQYKGLLSILLVAVIAVGGTFAYLKATDNPVLNTFSLSNTSTKVIEDEGGSEESKIVSVKNTGSSDVFVRVRVVVSAGTSTVQYVKAAPNESERDANTIYVVIGDGWEKDGSNPQDYYYYQNLLPAGKTTLAVVNGVYCGKNIDADSFDVIVYQEAVLGSGAYQLSQVKDAFQNVS